MLFLIQFLAVIIAIRLDYIGKLDDYRKIVSGKISILFIKSSYEKRMGLSSKCRPISVYSLIFQILNYIYIVAYLVIVFLARDIYSFPIVILILCLIYFISEVAYLWILAIVTKSGHKYNRSYPKVRIRLLAKHLCEINCDIYADPVVVYKQLKEAHYGDFKVKEIEQALVLLQNEDILLKHE